MDWVVTLVGLAAAIGTRAAYVPQVWRSISTRSVRDLSLWMTLLLTFGIALWVVYGVLRRDLVVIVANAVSLGLVGTLLVLKLGERRRD
jgi:MtN3 and saliva related transmembrane protein